jgi:hypothetical protein
MNQYFRTTERKGLQGNWSFASLKLITFTFGSTCFMPENYQNNALSQTFTRYVVNLLFLFRMNYSTC